MARRSLRQITKRRISRKELPALLRELAGMHDRAAGIVAATLLEGALEEMIATQMVRLSKEEYGQLFSGDAPLSSFSAKIRVARAFKLIHKSTARELNIIKEIRNVFAHAQVSVSFETPEVIEQVGKITMVDQMNDPLWEGLQGEISISLKLLRTDTPRLKYLSNCFFYMTYFRYLGPADPDLIDEDE